MGWEGFTLAEIDTTLSKYCEKSEKIWFDKLINFGLSESMAKEMSAKQVKEELENGLQALEFQLNTRESSRGDYPSK